MLIPKNHFSFGIHFLSDQTGTTYRIRAVSIPFDDLNSIYFNTEHATLEDAEKELRGLKIYLRQGHSHVDTDANYTKII